MKNRVPTNFLLVVSLICSGPLLASSSSRSSSPKKSWYDQAIKNRGVIYFYKNGHPYYEFTNFFEAPIKLDKDGAGKPLVWQTTEQYYQAGKFTDMTIRNLIRVGEDTQWPGLVKSQKKGWGPWAFYIGNETLSQHKRADWTKPAAHTKGLPRNLNRMLVALRAKFLQNPALGKMLLGTYPQVLVEDSPFDGTFGVGGDPSSGIAQGTGQNLLGRMLMHVRMELWLKFVAKDPHPERDFDPNTSYTLDKLLNPKIAMDQAG